MSWSKLSDAEQKVFAKNCVQRRKSYTLWCSQRKIDDQKDILIVGDRPGPKAPQQDNYHHTPFYSKLYSGGWLNSLLVKSRIAEDRLMWINSATWDNKPESSDILQRPWKTVIALGNNAAKWLDKNNIDYVKVSHPQAHKRFKSGEPYPLIDLLVSELS